MVNKINWLQISYSDHALLLLLLCGGILTVADLTLCNHIIICDARWLFITLMSVNIIKIIRYIYLKLIKQGSHTIQFISSTDQHISRVYR